MSSIELDTPVPIANLQHFYIPEDQSIYLLSHRDAQKLKGWLNLCKAQLHKLGFRQVEMIGKGAYGFAFAGMSSDNEELVFKFSRANLPQHVQERLEEEAFILGCVEHPNVPRLRRYLNVGKQAILVMERAKGLDLEQISLRDGPLSPELVVKIALQLTDILKTLRAYQRNGVSSPIVHGDIKPSNIVLNEETETIGLIDWGSSVFAQIDANGQFVSNNVMDLMSSDLQQTNARLGDVYFIGEEQLNGGLSSPRFDEQGLASTLYALASGQSCRYGNKVISPVSVGLPIEIAKVIDGLLSDDLATRIKAGDYLLRNAHYWRNLVFAPFHPPAVSKLLPSRVHAQHKDIDTVVYSSRKSFLRQRNIKADWEDIDDVQLERYYKNFMQGMGENEKAFLSSLSRLGRYPVVGGIAIHWRDDGVFIDSSLDLYDVKLKHAFEVAVNNVVNLARAIQRIGVFKCCLFNARNTLHIERENEQQAFLPNGRMGIPYDKSAVSSVDHESRMHSYFEDGKDPDEQLSLPQTVVNVLERLNHIHHTGCIIFEVLPQHLKIHSYYKLLNLDKEPEFKACLAQLVALIPEIKGLGIAGFMKLPFKDTRVFEHHNQLPEQFYPKDPR